MCGDRSLLETAELIKRSELFIGIDSGPAHFANATNTSGIILLGHHASFKKYMPYSGNYAKGINSKIIYEDGPACNIKVSHVYKIVQEFLTTKEIHPCPQ